METTIALAGLNPDGSLLSSIPVAATQVTNLTASAVGALAKPSNPTSTQMVVLNADGSVGTKPIPVASTGTTAVTATPTATPGIYQIGQ